MMLFLIDTFVEIVSIQRGLMLREMVELHLDAFAGYLNATLGRMYIKSFIEWFVRADGAIAIAAIDCHQRVLGYALGARVGYDSMLNRDLLWVVGAAALRRPWVFFKRGFWSVVRFRLRGLVVGSPVSRCYSDLPDPVMSLVAIGVASSARKRGIGLCLMRAFEAKAKELGVRSLVLSVEKDRTATHRFYEKCGWRPYFSATGKGAEMKYCRRLDQDAQE